MKKWIWIDLFIFLLFGTLSLVFSPDIFSMVIVSVMCIILAVSFGKGIWMTLGYAEGFRVARGYIESVKNVTSSNSWTTFAQAEQIFQNRQLDQLWLDYKEQVVQDQKEKLICSDIEYVINDEVLALYSWKSVLQQIPGTLTALGLIGTFLGMILGISGISFSSVEAAISSITMLLAGIETAFYTSIIGVIFSMLFNISYRLAWNSMVREMGVFMNEFHKHIFPDEEKQRKSVGKSNMDAILKYLERIPDKAESYYNSLMPAGTSAGKGSNESTLMSEIWNGIQNGDFLFYIQPRYDLKTRNITSGEALLRWNHRRLGVVSPAIFLPMLEKNGYIVKLDCQLWETVCRTIRGWIDAGIRPVPISVNVSKMDLLVINVPEFFVQMVNKYQIPPQYIQVEIAENAYTQSKEITHQTEDALRQNGFLVIINGSKGEYDTMSSMAESKADALKIEYQVLEEKMAEDTTFLGELVEQVRKARMKLVASGIENVKQLNLLKKSGFAEGQGYFLYKPVEVEHFEELMRNNP